jgi:hypothetical protein
MTRLIFQFDDTFWLQISGTAMGTSVACAYATIYYSYHEETALLIPNNKLGIIYYRRYIDDAFIIQLLCAHGYSSLCTTMNDFGNNPNRRLQWIVEPAATSVNFLDLNITISSFGTITFRTYQKPMNLYLYLPPHTAHPPGVMKGLIYGSIQRFWNNNTETKDYRRVTKEFFQHLLARGHEPSSLRPLFLAGAKLVDTKLRAPTLPPSQVSTDKHRPVIVHQYYHPNQISRATLQQAFHETLHSLADTGNTERERAIGTSRLIIAYHRPKNLCDQLNPTKLDLPPGKRASDVLRQLPT